MITLSEWVWILVFTPAIAGVLSWLIDVRGIREGIGIVGTLIPAGVLIHTYHMAKSPHVPSASTTVAGFKFTFQLGSFSWYFAAVATLVAVAMAFGMASTSRKGYEWFFALMSYAGILGVFTVNNLVAFFFFWELMTFTSFMMVLRRDRHASLKYFVLSVIGAYAFLLAIGLLYSGRFMLRVDAVLTYILFLATFGVKAGTFPLHVWAPDAYPETDLSYTAFFSGALSKAGVYGFLVFIVFGIGSVLTHFMGSFHGHPVYLYIIAWIGALTVIVASFLAIFQDDLRKLLAYSSVGQVGYIILAIGVGNGIAIYGGMFHILSHAMFKGLLWLVAAAILLRTGTTKLSDLGGLAEKMPVTFAMALIGVLSLAGIPPLAGFASKWLIYEGAIKAHMPLVAASIFLGSGLAFAYVVRFLYAVWFGQRPSNLENVEEAPWPLLVGMAVLAIPSIVFGIFPGIITKFFNGIFSGFFGKAVVTGSYYNLVTSVGHYNALLVTIVMLVGLAVAGLIYLYGADARRVKVTDTYQSGNPVTEDYNLSIRRSFYKPLEEAMEGWLRISFDRFYERLGNMFEHAGDFMREGFYNGNVQSYAWYLAIILLVLALWGVL